MIGLEPKLSSSVNIGSITGLDMTSSLSSTTKPDQPEAFCACGNDTVAPVGAVESSMAALLEGVTARAGPCIFGGVFGGDGGVSV
jgi:hypothetical protein